MKHSLTWCHRSPNQSQPHWPAADLLSLHLYRQSVFLALWKHLVPYFIWNTRLLFGCLCFCGWCERTAQTSPNLRVDSRTIRSQSWSAVTDHTCCVSLIKQPFGSSNPKSQMFFSFFSQIEQRFLRLHHSDRNCLLHWFSDCKNKWMFRCGCSKLKPFLQ